MIVPRANRNLYPEYHQVYLREVQDEDILQSIDDDIEPTLRFFMEIGEERSHYRYASNKWTIKDILGHVTDTERIFAYRALCIARSEKISLPSFDEDAYVASANFNDQALTDLLVQFKSNRHSFLALFRSFDDRIWRKKGLSNQVEMDVCAFPFIMLGHKRHHINMIKAKYL